MNFLKKQGVAWVLTAVMIVIAIFIGRAGSTTDTPTPAPDETRAPIVSVNPGGQTSYVRDEAGVLTASEIRRLDELNNKLLSSMNVAVACVVSTDGRQDIYGLALEYASRLDIKSEDFIIVVDLSSMQYILVQGGDISHLFTDRDCEEYADRYLPDALDRGDYGEAFLDLAEALADWYEDHYLG